MKTTELTLKDLMIGDWVVINNIPRQVTFIDDCLNYKIIATGKQLDGSRVSYVGKLSDEVQPIPLTLEILEKNGFKKYNELYRLDIAEGVFVNADFNSKEPFVSAHNTCYRATTICWYLHQLQHALKLCGIKKEIIL